MILFEHIIIDACKYDINDFRDLCMLFRDELYTNYGFMYLYPAQGMDVSIR